MGVATWRLQARRAYTALHSAHPIPHARFHPAGTLALSQTLPVADAVERVAHSLDGRYPRVAAQQRRYDLAPEAAAHASQASCATTPQN
jgi:hypothetical protein